MEGVTSEEVILNASLASRAENNDTIDLAVLDGLKDRDVLTRYLGVHFQPFDPVHKRKESTVQTTDGKTLKSSKGAPQVILEMSANAAQIQPAVEKAANECVARGYHPLCVARAEGQEPWQFLGVLPPFDPPHEDARETIAATAVNKRTCNLGRSCGIF